VRRGTPHCPVTAPVLFRLAEQIVDLTDQVQDGLERGRAIQQTDERAEQVAQQVARTPLGTDLEIYRGEIHNQAEHVECKPTRNIKFKYPARVPRAVPRQLNHFVRKRPSKYTGGVKHRSRSYEIPIQESQLRNVERAHEVLTELIRPGNGNAGQKPRRLVLAE
jgi:hypothetical protein